MKTYADYNLIREPKASASALTCLLALRNTLRTGAGCMDVRPCFVVLNSAIYMLAGRDKEQTRIVGKVSYSVRDDKLTQHADCCGYL